MADVGDLKERFTRYATNLVVETARLTKNDLDDAVPKSGNHTGPGPTLEASLQIRPRPLGFTVEYPTDVASFTEFGTSPHIIRAKNVRVLVFEWPDGPPHLAGADGRYRFPYVHHPGSHKHDGWFAGETSAEAFIGRASDAADTVTF